MLEFFGVAKRIVLFLARVSPAETLGYLAIELAKQQQEEEPGGSGGAEAAGGAERRLAGRGGWGGPAAVLAAVPLVFGTSLDCMVAGGALPCGYVATQVMPAVMALSAQQQALFAFRTPLVIPDAAALPSPAYLPVPLLCVTGPPQTSACSRPPTSPWPPPPTSQPPAAATRTTPTSSTTRTATTPAAPAAAATKAWTWRAVAAAA